MTADGNSDMLMCKRQGEPGARLERDKDITSQMCRLADYAARLETSVGELQDRLSPVLSESRPTQEDCQKEEAAETPLGDAISEVRCKLSGINIRLRDILDRLEI